MLGDTQYVVEEALLGDVDTKQLRDLVKHDDQANTRLETSEHGGRNEVGDIYKKNFKRGNFCLFILLQIKLDT